MPCHNVVHITQIQKLGVAYNAMGDNIIEIQLPIAYYGSQS